MKTLLVIVGLATLLAGISLARGLEDVLVDGREGERKEQRIMEERDRINRTRTPGHPGLEDRSWSWLLADGACPICGQRHSPWIRRFAAWFGNRGAA